MKAEPTYNALKQRIRRALKRDGQRLVTLSPRWRSNGNYMTVNENNVGTGFYDSLEDLAKMLEVSTD